MDKRVVAEAALASSLIHPNVVSTYHYEIKQVRKHEWIKQVQKPLGFKRYLDDLVGQVKNLEDAPEGGLVIEDTIVEADWKLFLVQVKRDADLNHPFYQRLSSYCNDP